MENLPSDLKSIIYSAIKSVKPAALFPKNITLNGNILTIQNRSFDLSRHDNIYVTGAGKASGYMGEELEKILGEKITEGVVSVYDKSNITCRKIDIIEAGHPHPNKESIKAGKEILKIASDAGKNDLVFCLISGGGSALMEVLPAEISLEDFHKLTDVLIKSGADINEINTVRKSISQIKGGKLAEAIKPAVCITLIISDVIGDRLDSIASGPTCISEKENNPSAHEILRKYNLSHHLPESIINYLGQHSKISSSSKEKSLENFYNFIIGNNYTALQSAKEQAENLGYNSIIHNDRLIGEARIAGKNLAQYLKKKSTAGKPTCYLFGGETTVHVKGSGTGGRNQELVLAALTEMKNIKNEFYLASFGTDGRDGPTDAAGAFIDNGTFDEAEKLKLDPDEYLADNNSYKFFKQLNRLIKTGHTGTNVMDIQVILIQ